MVAKDVVEKAIANNQIAFFSQPWCPYCAKAKALLKNEYSDAQVEILELDERDDGADIKAYLIEKTGQSSVPNIFINKQHIGGNDKLQAAHKEGKLKNLLAAAA